jgi:hypothetical protein
VPLWASRQPKSHLALVAAMTENDVLMGEDWCDRAAEVDDLAERAAWLREFLDVAPDAIGSYGMRPEPDAFYGDGRPRWIIEP